MSETAKQWYVVRTIGGKENKVKEYIESEIRHSHLEEYISQVLIPTEKVYTIRNGKKVSKEKVSYPGYVLIEAAFVGQIPIIIRNIPNVLGFLGDTKEDSRKMIATPLRPQEVSRILGRVDELSSMEEENEIPFFVGETIKVTDGPFSHRVVVTRHADVASLCHAQNVHVILHDNCLLYTSPSPRD